MCAWASRARADLSESVGPHIDDHFHSDEIHVHICVQPGVPVFSDLLHGEPSLVLVHQPVCGVSSLVLPGRHHCVVNFHVSLSQVQ